jgi:hypothetical protein
VRKTEMRGLGSVRKTPSEIMLDVEDPSDLCFVSETPMQAIAVAKSRGVKSATSNGNKIAFGLQSEVQ